MLEIGLEGIKDPVVKDAFYVLLEFLRNEPTVNFKWKPFSLIFTTGVTDYAFRHGLGFKPKDALITDVSNDQEAFVNLDDSTSTMVSITASGACTVRLLLGNLDVNSQA